MQPSLTAADSPLADATYIKITRRIVPLLFMCYVLNYIDRTNIGYAQLQMKSQLNFSDAAYGLGAAIFFVGYLLFEVPSNLLLNKIGARKTLLRIMFMWGLASAGTMFVTTPTQFYIARFLLGVFEAGFFPGMMLYLTYWYAPARRGSVVSLFMAGSVVAGIVGGPIAGWIIQNMDGVNGLHGWQWMFLLEGLPSCLLGIVVYIYLADLPADAPWLNKQEKELVMAEVSTAASASSGTGAHLTTQAIRDPKVYLLSFSLFAVLCGAYALSFWLPTVIRGLGVASIQQIGLYSAIPGIFGGIAMIFYGRHSDKHFERRWHFAVAALVAAFSLSATTLTSNSLGLSIALFALANAGIVSALPVFWALSSGLLSARSSVVGLALIAILSNFAGVFSPYILGLIRTATGTLTNGLYAISALMVIGAVLILSATSATSASIRAQSPVHG